jgi:rRNA processing protein Krr1/Pno1
VLIGGSEASIDVCRWRDQLMTVLTTRKTKDPFIIFNAIGLIELLS